jgi:DNA topoisomerase-1
MDPHSIKLTTKYWMSKQFRNKPPLPKAEQEEWEEWEETKMIQEGGAAANKKQWTTLEHNGVQFPPPYEPHGIPVLYNGKEIVLPSLAEEYATLYSKFVGTEYISKLFNKNFWNDWKTTLKGVEISTLEGIDFSLIKEYIENKKKEKSSLSKEEKAQLKEERDKEDAKYKMAKVDGVEQPVGNFKIEPPGIFIGRGCHPKMGSIKRRIQPEEVTLNLGVGAKIPDPPRGHEWGEIIHDQYVRWLASWLDTINGENKYVWLAAQSNWKAESDRNKFDLARKLKKNIKHIKDMNETNMNNPEEKMKQIATALYFIDNLALRVGNEKSADEADTVGVTTLRVEHIKLLDNLNIELDFLGKDSIRYVKRIQVSQRVYDNLKLFIRDKKPDDELFDKMKAPDLNKYLQEFMKGLTAKVFRTYNASYLFQKELKKISKKYDTLDEDSKLNKIYDEYNKANAKVALLCNHQKKVTGSFNDQIKKIDQQIKKVKKQIKAATKKERVDKLREKLDKLKTRKNLKVDLKGVALATSKTNYIDPRITVAFIKKHGLSPDKIYTKPLLDKFFWAFQVDENFKF